MQVMQTPEDPDDQVAVVKGMTAAFDDVRVAQLLSTALALEGRASDRLATIFNTIAPDADRKRRVLTMTRSMLSETDFGRSGQFQVLWTSMEELLVSYDEQPYVSESYRGALDGVGGRAERMAAADLPPELPAWMETLGQDSVRALSVTLLIDLLTLERDATRAAAIAEDMEALAEDLLMSGAYDDARTVTAALAARSRAPSALGRDACRQALDRLAESLAMLDTAALLGDVDAAGAGDDSRDCRGHRPGRHRSTQTRDDGRGRLRCLAPRRRCDRGLWRRRDPAPAVAPGRPALVRPATGRAAASAGSVEQRASRCCSRSCGKPIRGSRRRPSRH